MNRDLNKLSVAKITPPKTQNVVERQRLYKLLDKGADKPVTWVSAPAGSGKTTLVSSYIDSRKLPCLWYQVDAGDSDLATFFYYMGLAAKKANPRKRKPMPLLTPEYLGGIPTFTRRYFEELYSRVVRRASRVERQAHNVRLSTPDALRMTLDSSRFVIVFDNYQEVSSSQFHEMIVNGLEVIPEGIKVVIISRTEAPAQFSRFKANRKVNFIGWNEMRFNEEEIRQMALAIRGDRCQVDNCPTVQLLKEKTDGWAAGLTLMLSSAERQEAGIGDDGQARHCILPQTSGSAVFDYFAEEVFEKTDKSAQDFMLKTSFLPSMTAGMAEKLTGMSNSAKILSGLSRSHYFTDWIPGADPAYRYHPLFREFLMDKAVYCIGTDEIRQVQLDSACILEESGLDEAAEELYRKAGDIKYLSSFILKRAHCLAERGRFRTLDNWLDSLPVEIAESEPWFLYWMGVCHMLYDLQASRLFFERAFNLFTAKNDTAGALLSCAGAVDAIIAAFHDITALDKWIKWVHNKMGKNFSFPSAEIQTKVVTIMLLAMSFRPAWHKTVGQWRDRAESLIVETMNPEHKITLGSYLLMHYVMFGLFDKAARLIITIAPVADSAKISPHACILWNASASLAANYAEASGERALMFACRGLDLAGQTGVHIDDMYLFYVAALGSLLCGDLPKSESFLMKMAEAPGGIPSVHAIDYHLVSAGICIQRNDVKRALDHFLIASDMAERAHHDVFLGALTYTGAALMQFELGDKKAAGRTMKKMYRTGIADSHLSRYMVLMTESYFLFKSGKYKDGLKKAAEFLSIGRAHGAIMIPFWPKNVLTEVCVHALNAGIEVNHVKELINRFNLMPTGVSYINNWPYPVKIFTGLEFEIIRDGKALVFTGKVQKKPLELLKALIASGGRGIPVENIIDALWPESDGDAAYSAFTTTLQRLRKLLGRDDAVKIQAGKADLNHHVVWVDSLSKQHK